MREEVRNVVGHSKKVNMAEKKVEKVPRRPSKNISCGHEQRKKQITHLAM